jgi:chromate transporter
LGFISFGGPAGQIAIMHRELVDRRRWISEERFLHALNYCMLLPGPEAQQLAIYIGWLLHRTWGGIVAGAFFVIPSIFILLALSYVYAAYGNLPAVAGVLAGFKPVVVAIVVEAVLNIGGRALKRRAHFVVAAAAFVASCASLFHSSLWSQRWWDLRACGSGREPSQQKPLPKKQTLKQKGTLAWFRS